MADQLGLPLQEPQRRPDGVDPGEVRAELLAVLGQARSARVGPPWHRKAQRYHRVVFPQMASWLPEAEAEQLRAEFAVELDRIEGLLDD